MLRILLLLFIVVPALEIVTIIQVGQVIGGWPTFFLIVAMSLLGAYLVKVQGLRVWKQIRDEMAMGMIPGESLLDGACVLVGGTLLLTPGFLTDALGLLMLLPFLRGFFKGLLKVWLFRLMSRGQFFIHRR
jgi:UPF0716 protein FxsA